jgi:hypothetical protein
MAEWLTATRLVDLALLAVIAEALVLLAWRGAAPRRLLLTLAAGGCVLLAWRMALAGLPWPWVAGAMACALACHVVDIGGRLPPRR